MPNIILPANPDPAAELVRRSRKHPLRSKKVWITVGTALGFAGMVVSGVGGPFAWLGPVLIGVGSLAAQGVADAATAKALGEAVAGIAAKGRV